MNIFQTKSIFLYFWEIPTKLRTLSKHKFQFNVRASLLDTLETGDTYYEIDEILKMKKAEPIFL